MAEYIEREKTYKEIDRFKGYIGFDEDMVKRVKIGLSRIPAADVRPVVKAKWRLGGYGQISDATVKWYDQFLCGGFFYCSACKGRSSVKFNFCPNCGADMRGGKNDG